MPRHPPEKPTTLITDLKDVATSETSLLLSERARNVERLRDLPIEELWLIRANQKDLANGRLIKEIIGYPIDGSEETCLESEYLYTNNEEGLLIKVQRPLTFDAYEYEFYQ